MKPNMDLQAELSAELLIEHYRAALPSMAEVGTSTGWAPSHIGQRPAVLWTVP